MATTTKSVKTGPPAVKSRSARTLARSFRKPLLFQMLEMFQEQLNKKSP